MKKPRNQREATPTDGVIGQRIRQRRLELHISQSDLGNKLGISFQQVQKYEKGVNRLGSARLIQVAHALDTDVNYFIGDLGNSRKPVKLSPVQSFLATKDGLDINEAMLRISNHELRRSVIEFVRKLGSNV